MGNKKVSNMDFKGSSMIKKKIIVKGPALSSSGYGEQTRFALRSLKQHEDKFDIFLINIPWGRTGEATLVKEEKEWLDFLQAKTHIYSQQAQQGMYFDISLQITIPTEFEKISPFNIGYTAGIETTKVSRQWIEKANTMEQIIVPSKHSKDVFENTTYKNEDGSILKVETPVSVCAFPVTSTKEEVPILELSSDFNFLSVAQWGPRKNVEATIVNFLEEFKDEDVGLVLKLNIAKNSTMDRLATEERLSSLVKNVKQNIGDTKCKIYLLHGSLTDEEMKGLYYHPKIKAFVTTTHGEGFGLPIFEAAIASLPIAAPNWSAHAELLHAPKKEKGGKTKNKPFFTKIDYDMRPVQPEAVWEGVIEKDSQWCWVKPHSVKAAMRELYKNNKTCKGVANKLSKHIKENYSEAKQFDTFVKVSKIVKEKKILKPEKVNGISFCIPTNGKREEKTLSTIDSIKKQKWSIPYEIIICGDVDKFSSIEGVTTLNKKEEAHSKKVGSLRNGAASLASYDVIVFCDDDIILSDDWLEKTIEFSEKEGWEVLGNRILNPDGTRHWDKATLFPRILVDYDHPENDENLMQTSGFFLIRKNILKQIPWDETKLVYGDRENNGIPEDVQFHFDMKKNNVMLKFNKMACVWHNDDSYTEFQGQTLNNKDILERFNIDFKNEKNQKFVDLLLHLERGLDG